MTAGFSTDGVGAGGNGVNRFAGAVDPEEGSVLSSVELSESELFSSKRMPRGLEELNANPRTTLAPSKPTNCQIIRRARESWRLDGGEDD